MASAPVTDLEGARARVAELQATLARAGARMRQPPPEPTTCCGRGCNGCVWEGFYAAVNLWIDEAHWVASAIR